MLNEVAGITGWGGMSIALNALGKQSARMGQAQGIGMEPMHSVMTLSSSGFNARRRRQTAR